MDVRNNQSNNNAVFPRQPAGNQDNSVRQANKQMSQAFTAPSNNLQAKDSSNLLQLILKLIISLLNQLLDKPSHKEPSPPPDEGARGVYGAAISKAPPPDEGSRGVYGAAVSQAPQTK